MTITSETMRQLRQALLADPALQARIHQSHSPRELAGLLGEIATARGIAAEAADLEQFLAELPRPASPASLSDQQLEAVAGGISHEGFTALSGLTFWIACAIMSANNEAITMKDHRGEEITYGARLDLQWC